MSNAAEGTPDVASPLPGPRLLLLGVVLMFTMFVGTFPQYALGVLAPLLLAEIDISEFELGLVASALYVSAAVIARFGGRQLDRMHGRAALLLLLLASTGSLVLIAASTSIAILVIGVLVAGVAIGANNPVTNRVIAYHVPAGRRGSVIGVKQIGVKVANVAAGVLVPLFAHTLGWRPGLRTFAVVAVLVGVASLRIVPAERRRSVNRGRQGSSAHLRGQVRWLRYYAAFMAIGMSAITTYLPLHAVQNVGMSLAQAGLVVTVMGTVAVGARLVWAALADRMNSPETLLIALSAVGASALAMIAAAGAVGPWILWVAAAVVGATVGSWTVVAHLTIVVEVDADRAASATGLMQATFVAGQAVGAPVFGALIAVTGSFATGWWLTAALSLGASAVAVIEQRRRARTAAATDEIAV